MKGILLINLGTPDNCDPKSVRRYLKQFLNDPMVVDLPAIVRWFLVNWLIIPCRYKKSAEAYQKIWLEGNTALGLESGSPLRIHSEAMKQALAIALGAEYQVELGMRYGNPSIQAAVEKLKDCESLKVLPLFPQYAAASSGSAIRALQNCIAQLNPWQPDQIEIQEHFYEHPAFICAYAFTIQKHIEKHMKENTLDILLFSYHGLPERQNDKSIPSYRTQCFATSDAIAKVLGLSKNQYCVAFQSRLGRTPWIKPYTDLILPQLIEQGVRNIAIACPSFVADCLETLEEINIRVRKQWRSLGGEAFRFIPCLNTEPLWLQAMSAMIRE